MPTLQELLCPDAIQRAIRKVKNHWGPFELSLGAPVHRLENVDGDPMRTRTTCGAFVWTNLIPVDHDLNRVACNAVTCRACLEAMADTPVIVRVV